jgi:hypothetical protein
METCFVPNKYLSPSQTVYIGVLCEECDFSLKASYLKEEMLKDGESKLFHLKAGDNKLFKLDEFFQAEKESIQISSFNMRMKSYKMAVQIVEKKNPSNVIQVPINSNWIGGQQAIIKPKAEEYNSKYEYRILITANENGIFNIEARTSKAIIPMEDKLIKFENVKESQNLCFSYKIDKSNVSSNVIIDAKSIKGDVTFKVFPQNMSTLSSEFKVESGKDTKYEITNQLRQTKNASSGVWYVCASSLNTSAFFTIQIYLDKNYKMVKEYKQLLFSNKIYKLIFRIIKK